MAQHCTTAFSTCVRLQPLRTSQPRTPQATAKSLLSRLGRRGGRGAHQRLRGPPRERGVAQEHGEQVPPRKVRRAGAAVPVKHLPRSACSSGRGRPRCVRSAWSQVAACGAREVRRAHPEEGVCARPVVGAPGVRLDVGHSDVRVLHGVPLPLRGGRAPPHRRHVGLAAPPARRAILRGARGAESRGGRCRRRVPRSPAAAWSAALPAALCSAHREAVPSRPHPPAPGTLSKGAKSHGAEVTQPCESAAQAERLPPAAGSVWQAATQKTAVASKTSARRRAGIRPHAELSQPRRRPPLLPTRGGRHAPRRPGAAAGSRGHKLPTSAPAAQGARTCSAGRLVDACTRQPRLLRSSRNALGPRLSQLGDRASSSLLSCSASCAGRGTGLGIATFITWFSGIMSIEQQTGGPGRACLSSAGKALLVRAATASSAQKVLVYKSYPKCTHRLAISREAV